MIKTILGYQIEPGVTEDEYEDWLFTVHVPDILANPYVDRLVFNKVLRPVTAATGGTPVRQEMSLYRIAEMHFADEEAYQNYLRWFADHPVPAERGPAGRTAFAFYVVASATAPGERAGGPVRIWFQKHTVEGRLPWLDDAYRRHFAAVARPGTQVEIRTLPPETYAADVPEGLVRYGGAEALFGSYFACCAAQAESSGFDAFLIGASQDPGLGQSRALAGIPVLGYGETAFHLAALTGRSFGIVGFIPELEEPIRENLACYGLLPRLRAFGYLDAGPDAVLAALRGSPGAFLDAFARAADRVAALGAEVIVPGEGLPNEILWAAGVRSHAGAAILDADGALVKVAELLVDLRRLGSLGISGNGYRSRRLPGDAMKHLLSLFQPRSAG